MAKKKMKVQNPFAEQALDKMVPPGSSKRKQRKQRKQGQPIPSSEVGCRPGYARRMLHMNKGQFEKLKAIAYWDRRDLKDVVEEAFTNYLKGRRVKPIPSKVEN